MPAGNGWAWQRLKKTILERDNYACRYCGAPATVVDHVVGVLFGGTDDPSNLVASCEPCNNKKAQQEARAGKMRAVS
jgi:5-methylcytosine-specific restriction endonuclease McrA